jgi:hypothetical protein
MNNLVKISSIAVLLAAAAAPALAQSSQASGTSSEESSSQASSASSQPSSSGMSSSSQASSSSAEQAGVEVNYGQVISALQAGKTVDLSTITQSSTINFVLVSQVKAHGNTTALENALKKNASEVSKLQADVEANATLKAKLDAAGYTSAQVVAVIANDDGSFTVVINDQG